VKGGDAWGVSSRPLIVSCILYIRLPRYHVVGSVMCWLPTWLVQLEPFIFGFFLSTLMIIVFIQGVAYYDAGTGLYVQRLTVATAPAWYPAMIIYRE